MKKLGLIIKIPFYMLFRSVGYPVLLPFNYTFSITYKCNSKCKTCNIWKIKCDDELTTDEWIEIIKSLGGSPFWITISGGEPFLRRDLVSIVEAIADYNDPAILNIPTNGLLNVIPERLEEILRVCDGIDVVINFSIDGIGEEHDRIRGVVGNWDRVVENYRKAVELKRKYDNLTVGIHTVISRWNVERFKDIARDILRMFNPDQYITEIAEVRNEMKNAESNPTPPPIEYAKVVDFLIDLISNEIRNGRWRGLAKITESFRIEYYNYVKKLYLGDSFDLKSYAGFASCQISPIGDVWECAVYATSMGNLREYDYDFKRLWKSKKAREVRRKVKDGHVCPLANENYVNMLFNPKVMIRVVSNLLIG